MFSTQKLNIDSTTLTKYSNKYEWSSQIIRSDLRKRTKQFKHAAGRWPLSLELLNTYTDFGQQLRSPWLAVIMSSISQFPAVHPGRNSPHEGHLLLSIIRHTVKGTPEVFGILNHWFSTEEKQSEEVIHNRDYY